MEIARPDEGWGGLESVVARARRASAELRREGTEIRFVRTIFVPEDDACFCLFAAASADDALEAAHLAGIRCESIAEGVAIDDRSRGDGQ